MSCPFGMLGAPIICLALDGFGLVLIRICWRDLCPLQAVLLLLSFALFGPVFVLAFLLLLLWLLSFLLQLLDLSFQGENLLLFWGQCIPCVSQLESFELVIGKEHEGIGVDLCSFLVFVLLFADVGDEFSVRNGLVCLDEVSQEVIGHFPPCCQRINQVFDVGVELGDVAVNGQDVRVKCTEFGLDVHDC